MRKEELFTVVSQFPIQILTHFQPKFHFYTPLKHLKTGGFLMFSGGTEVEHWLKMA